MPRGMASLGRLRLRLLGEEHRVDVREHTARRDRHAAEELVELLVVAHRELDVARDDARFLVVARRVPPTTARRDPPRLTVAGLGLR